MAQMRMQAEERLWDEVTKDALRRGRIRHKLIRLLRKSIRRLTPIVAAVLATAALLLVISALTSGRPALAPFNTLAAAATDDGDRFDALNSWGRAEYEGVRGMFSSAYGGLTAWGQDPDGETTEMLTVEDSQSIVNLPDPTPLSEQPRNNVAPVATMPAATRTPVPAQTTRPTATPTLTRGSAGWVAALEQRIHELVNQRRQSPLDFDVALASVARSHSADMANSNYFSHTNQRGQSPSDRGAVVGYDCHKDYGSYYTYGLAENIYYAGLYSQYWTRNGIVVRKDYYELEALASRIVDGWMTSTGHRENILDTSYDVEGIGVAVNDDERVYVTQNFC